MSGAAPGPTGWAAAASVAAATALAVAAVLADGLRGALSVWLGAAVVVGFFASSALPLVVVRGQEQRAGAGTAVLLLTYTLRLAVAVAVLRVAGRSDAVAPRWTGLAVVVCALAWVTAQAVVSLRAPGPQNPPGRGPSGAGR